MSGILFHKHRLVPGHMGGTYDAPNVIHANVAMHAFLHKCLWEEHGRWQDRIAWQVLSGMISKEQGRVQAVSEMGKQRWANDPAYREKMRAAQSRPCLAKSTRAKQQWSDPVFRSKFTNGQTRRWSDPAAHVQASERMKGNTQGRGHKHTKEALQKIGAASRSQWASFSDEKKLRIINARRKSRMTKVVH